MSTAIKTGQADVTLYFRAYKISDGSEETGIAYNTAGLSMQYIREREAEVAATVGSSPAPVTLAADDTAHTDWGFRNITGNLYRTDWPDAAFLTGAKFVIPKVLLSGYTFILEPVVDLVGADPRLGTVDAQVKGIDAGVVTTIQSGLATASALSTLATAVNTIDDFVDTEIASIISSLASLTTTINAINTAVDTEVASILAAVDTEVADIKAKTDQLTFTVANRLDVNMKNINDRPMTGNGITPKFGVS